MNDIQLTTTAYTADLIAAAQQQNTQSGVRVTIDGTRFNFVKDFPNHVKLTHVNDDAMLFANNRELALENHRETLMAAVLSLGVVEVSMGPVVVEVVDETNEALEQLLASFTPTQRDEIAAYVTAQLKTHGVIA